MRTALIIVDVQVDFCEGGALAVTGGAKTASAISAYAHDAKDLYSLAVATRDWHLPLPEANDGHFALDGEPDFVSTWPEHCVQGTVGADYHPELVLPAQTVEVLKGEGRHDYSGFSGRTLDGAAKSLAGTLAHHEIERVDIVGLATDHCVLATALDALDLGYAVRVLTNLTAGVAVRTTIDALTRLSHAGAVLIHSEDVR